MSEFARYLLTASPAVIYTCKADDTYATMYVSENVVDLLGYDPQDFLEDSRFWVDRVHPEDLPAVVAEVDAVFTRGHHVREYRFRVKSGTYRWLRDEIRLAYNEASKTRGLVGSWLDITERKMLEERYRRLAGFSSDYLHVCTRTGTEPFRIQWLDGAVAAITGYNAEELLAMGCWLTLVHPDDRQAVISHLLGLRPGDRKKMEFRIVTKAREVRWVSEKALCEGGPSAGELILSGAVTDITERKRAEDELKHSHDLLKYIIEHARSAVAVHDRELRYLYVSQRYLDEYQVKDRDVIGRHHYEVFPDLPQKWRDVHQRALAGEVLSAEEDSYVREDGSVDWTRWECRPWHEADGSIGGIIVYTEVITERKHAEESLREAGRLVSEALQQAEFERDKTHAILESMGDGISIQDPDLRIIYQNAAHRGRMGEHLGEFCYHAYQGRADVCPECHLIQSFDDGQVHVRETSASPAGELRHFQIVSTPLFDSSGKLIAGIEAVRDITERKRAEEHLRQKTDELEGVNQELEAFSYTLSHDLRSYLARISLAGESLLTSEGEHLSQEGRFCRQTIVNACQGMDALIDAMLTLAHISRQKLQVEEIDLSALARQIGDELALNEFGRTLCFDIAPGLRATGDTHLLHVVLENLLGNACKYTRGREAARIALSASQQDGRVVFAIADNGIGFDMSEKENLFRSFQRLSNARSFPGFGIGLTTVKRIIQRHGGEIWAEAVAGEGATFYFTIPG